MTNFDNIAHSGVSRTQVCELCCEELAGKTLDKMSTIDWYCTGWSIPIAQFAVMALKFLGLMLFFSVAIWFFPVRETSYQRKQRLLSEALEKKQKAADYWKHIQWEDFLAKGAINDFHDNELHRKLELVKQLDSELTSFYDDEISRIRKAEVSGEITHEQALEEEVRVRNEYNVLRERDFRELENLAKEVEEQPRLKDIYDNNLIVDNQLDALYRLEREAGYAEKKALASR
jgi:hypothetical protein